MRCRAAQLAPREIRRIASALSAPRRPSEVGGSTERPYSAHVTLEKSAAVTLADFAQSWRREDFVVGGMEESVLTPALVLNRDLLDGNIAAMHDLLGVHWRPHVKTSKLEWTMRRLVAAGVTRCKCATTLELECALRAGFEDVLVAFAHRGPAARRIAELAAATSARVSVLVEDSGALDQWRGTRVCMVIDVDPGIHRTGIPCDRRDSVVALAQDVAATGLTMYGLHSYEASPPPGASESRLDWCAPGFEALSLLCADLAAAGHPVHEIATSGSETWSLALSSPWLAGLPCAHTVSPGSVVYNDAYKAPQVPGREHLRPAAVVVTRVMSMGQDRLTLDAGHKAIAPSITGLPGVILGCPELRMETPSEEHGPVTVLDRSSVSYGDMVAVVPSHIGPTVNLHDHAVIVSDGEVVGVEPVSARGHEAPL
jgi:D-serine deaminase-like pyridoxal phosphate-dependent protein